MSEQERDLSLELTLDAPRPLIWRCWTEAELLMQWFTPAPWRTTDADLDPRPGGRMNVTMCSPEGEEMPNQGVFLEVIDGRKLVMTDAYSEGWLPSAKPFMTAVISLADAGPDATAYRALVRHWSPEDRRSHENRGFHDGWTKAARQLEAVAQSLSGA